MHTNSCGCKFLLHFVLVIVLELQTTSSILVDQNIFESEWEVGKSSLTGQLLNPPKQHRFRRVPVLRSGNEDEQTEFKSSKRSKRYIEEEHLDEAIKHKKETKVLNIKPYKAEFMNISKGLVTQEWIAENLEYHNRMREMHLAPPLKLDYKLCKAAQVKANKLATTNKGETKINFGNLVLGENVLARKAKVNGSRDTLLHLTGSFAPTQWYDELVKHDWKKNEYNSKTEHATQIIWQATKAMGCGRSITTPKKGDRPFMLIICQYDPIGNDKKKSVFKANVHVSTENAEPE